MSGTSLDGLDVVHCTFTETGGKYSFRINACDTFIYPETWQQRLRNLPSAPAAEFAWCHNEYGLYAGSLILTFLERHHLNADFVASHGHTIFHRPDESFTSQIGEGAIMAAVCGLPVICDFRTGDVAHGGQGAPLVPIGDELLFSQYTYCLNIGGFANISMNLGGKRVAFDISPANIVLNQLAGRIGLPYDDAGKIASVGNVRMPLLQKLNDLPYFGQQPPKSLGREWVESHVLPIIQGEENEIPDLLRTYTEHIAMQVAAAAHGADGNSMLSTGGGAYNAFLIERIKAFSGLEVIVPIDEIVNYKEALIFALLGLLRWNGIPNSLASVTGATGNVCGGCIYLP